MKRRRYDDCGLIEFAERAERALRLILDLNPAMTRDGYVENTREAALWGLYGDSSFKDQTLDFSD